MNTLVLLAVALLVFAMGLRFYAKFLTSAVFASSPTHAAETVPGATLTRTGLVVALGHQSAAVVGATTVIGAGIAVLWGWAPAFLWIVVGSTVGAGLLALGGLWLGERGHPAQIIGERGARLLYALLALLLVLLTPLLASAIGHLLAAYPGAVWPFLLHFVLALALARRLRATPWRWGGAALAAAGLLAVAVAAGARLPVEVNGAVGLSLGHSAELTIGAHWVWSGLALVAAYAAIRRSPAALEQPRGALMLLLLGIGLTLLIAALVAVRPEVAAPPRRLAADVPAVLPLLFITVSGGAIAGLHALLNAESLAHGDRPLACRLAYGSALTDGALALVVLLVAAVGFASAEAWAAAYPAWPTDIALHVWLTGFVHNAAHTAGMLGVDYAWTSSFFAFVLAGLALTALETGLRVLQHVSAELSVLVRPLGPLPWARETVAVAAIGALALGGEPLYASLDLWTVLGATNHLFAAGVLVLLATALAQRSRPLWPAAVPALLLLAAALWGLLDRLLLWTVTGRWLLFTLGVVSLALGAWLGIETLRALLTAIRAARVGDGENRSRGSLDS